MFEGDHHCIELSGTGSNGLFVQQVIHWLAAHSPQTLMKVEAGKLLVLLDTCLRNKKHC